jgi:hypothetical protein
LHVLYDGELTNHSSYQSSQKSDELLRGRGGDPYTMNSKHSLPGTHPKSPQRCRFACGLHLMQMRCCGGTYTSRFGTRPARNSPKLGPAPREAPPPSWVCIADRPAAGDRLFRVRHAPFVTDIAKNLERAGCARARAARQGGARSGVQAGPATEFREVRAAQQREHEQVMARVRYHSLSRSPSRQAEDFRVCTDRLHPPSS